MNKRRDNRGRILHNGEIQLPNGRYRFKYTDANGEVRYLFSYRLDHNDRMPKEFRKKGPSLRELERKVQADLFDKIVPNGGNLTVLELVEKYVATKVNVRESTKTGYKTIINILKKEKFGNTRIDKIKISDAKIWLIKLQQHDGRGYSSIHSIRGVLRPAFQMAVDDDLIRKNPFAFELVSVIVNDSVRRDAVSRKDERRFLDFIKNDPHFCRYYEGVYILFKTGLRISEFCGLTINDIDFEHHKLKIDHQIHKRARTGYQILPPKTEAGNRILPMTPDVEECFRTIVANRNAPKKEPVVDGKMGFLYFDKDGSIMYSLHWEKYFQNIREKYNKTYLNPLPCITPHVCRHTYCSNMAKSGMNPKTLQYLMGHSDISVTLNTYTHVKYEDVEAEVIKLGVM